MLLDSALQDSVAILEGFLHRTADSGGSGRKNLVHKIGKKLKGKLKYMEDIHNLGKWKLGEEIRVSQKMHGYRMTAD